MPPSLNIRDHKHDEKGILPIRLHILFQSPSLNFKYQLPLAMVIYSSYGVPCASELFIT